MKLQVKQGSELEVSTKAKDKRSPFVFKSARSYNYDNTMLSKYFKLFNDLHFVVVGSKNINEITTEELTNLVVDAGFSKDFAKNEVIPTFLRMGVIHRIKRGIYRIDYLTSNFATPTKESNDIIDELYGVNLTQIKTQNITNNSHNTQININCDPTMILKAVDYMVKNNVDFPTASSAILTGKI